MRILDVSAGNRAVWFDKKNPLATFVDIRPEVEPDIVADTRSMPFIEDSTYDLAVFDPPHVNFGANAEMSKTYGHHTTSDIRDIITRTAQELHRIIRSEGLMAFKWNDHDQKLEKILSLMPNWEPLFGHKTSQRNMRSSQTFWVLMRNLKN